MDGSPITADEWVTAIRLVRSALAEDYATAYELTPGIVSALAELALTAWRTAADREALLTPEQMAGIFDSPLTAGQYRDYIGSRLDMGTACALITDALAGVDLDIG